MRPLGIPVILLLLAVMCLGAFAQQMNLGQIAGTVLDPSGHAVADAWITCEHSATGRKFTARSNEIGSFVLPNLPAGEFAVQVEARTFATALSKVVIQAGRTTQLEFRLRIAAVDQEVTILETAPLLQTRSSEIDDVVNQQQVTDIPLNSRQFLQLALLSDAVVRPPGGTRGAALQQAGDLINVAGQRSGHNIYLVDGAKVTDEYFNNLVLTPSIDAIQEFRIQKALYSAEYGGKASALINVVTKSGTNRPRGTLFEFLRNSSFDAKNYFADPALPIPLFQQNQFGGTLGGPVTVPGLYSGKGRTFFFLSYEGQRVRKSETQLFTVPTAAMRAGNLAGLVQAYDPLNGRAPFAGNVIPTDRLDSIAQALLAKVPLPNLPGRFPQNYRAVEKSRSNLDQGNVRIDHSFTDRDTILGRFSIFEADAFQPFGSGVLNESLVPGFGRGLTTHTRNAVIDYRHAFSPTTLNTIRAGWLHVSGGQSSRNNDVDFGSQTGLLGITRDARDFGYPQISFGNQFSTIGDPTTFVSRTNRSLELSDSLMLHRGRHTVTVGGYLYLLRFNPVNAAAARGSFSFTPRWTSSTPGGTNGNPFAEFLLGYPTSANAGIGRADERGQTWWFHPYVQDDFQLAPSLMLNLGLRWEYNAQMRDRDNRLSLVDFSSGTARYVIASDSRGNLHPSANELLPLIPVPYTTSAEAGWDRSLLSNSLLRFSPRVGLSWRLPTSRDVVLRAGYGIHNNQWAYSVQQSLASNLPFFATRSVTTSASETVPVATTRTMLGTNTLGTVGGSTMLHNFQPEYNQAWSLSIQHQITPTLLWEIGYFGSRINHADNSTYLNVPVPCGDDVQCQAKTVIQRRPDPRLAEVRAIRWDGWSNFNAMRLRVEKRSAGGIYLLTNYTWSKSIDDASDPGATEYESNVPQNVYTYNSLGSERALSSFDHRHRFTLTAAYPLPLTVGSGLVRTLTSGWQLSGIFSAQSGSPFTVNLPSDNANVGPGPAQRPDVIRNPNLSSGRTPERWFDAEAFVMPAPFTFGNAGRNNVFAPGEVLLDAALQKEFRLPKEQTRLQLRIEMFNVLNRPNFAVPNRIAFTPNFGRISAARDPRQMQFALKLLF